MRTLIEPGKQTDELAHAVVRFATGLIEQPSREDAKMNTIIESRVGRAVLCPPNVWITMRGGAHGVTRPTENVCHLNDPKNFTVLVLKWSNYSIVLRDNHSAPGVLVS